jgi:hypothetical protein
MQNHGFIPEYLSVFMNSGDRAGPAWLYLPLVPWQTIE